MRGLDAWLRTARGVDRGLRGERLGASYAGNHFSGEFSAKFVTGSLSRRSGAAMGFPGVHSIELDARPNELPDDRCGGHSAVLGHSAGALPAHFHPVICAPTGATPLVDDPNVSNGGRGARPLYERVVSNAAA